MRITEFYKPMDTRDAYERLIGQKKATLMAGGMFLRLQNRTLPLVIDLEPLGLRGIDVSSGLSDGSVPAGGTFRSLRIGAMTTLREIEVHPDLPPLLRESVRQIAGIGVRNLATIGGSVMGRYPFSDINTALMALEARLHFHLSGPVPMAQYMASGLGESDILLAVEVPHRDCCRGAFRTYKEVYTAFALVNAAVCLHREPWLQGQLAHPEPLLTVAIGARPGRAISVRVPATFSEISQIETGSLLEFRFGDDYRATAECRQRLAKVLVEDCMEAIAKEEVPRWK